MLMLMGRTSCNAALRRRNSPKFWQNSKLQTIKMLRYGMRARLLLSLRQRV